MTTRLERLIWAASWLTLISWVAQGSEIITQAILNRKEF